MRRSRSAPSPAEDAPVSLGVIFDSSGSMSSKMDRAKEAVIEFFKTANPQDEFFMITFSDEPEEISGLHQFRGRDPEQAGVRRARASYRLARRHLHGHQQDAARRSIAKKALLIISDGGDNHSRYTENEIKSLVKEADVMIYAIGIYDRYASATEERLGPQLLSDITELTGAAPSPSTIPTTWGMSRRKSASSCATNTSSDTVPAK